jgi:hypothetical protein
MPLIIKKPQMPQKTFILNRALHVDKAGNSVEEDDVRGVKVLGGPGSAFYEDDAKERGLNETHREGYVAPSDPVEPILEPAPAPEPAADSKPEPVGEPVLLPVQDGPEAPKAEAPRKSKNKT